MPIFIFENILKSLFSKSKMIKISLKKLVNTGNIETGMMITFLLMQINYKSHKNCTYYI